MLAGHCSWRVYHGGMRRLLPLLLASVGLMAAGCIDVEMAFEVGDTGSITMQADVIYQDSFLELMAMGEGGSTEGVCAEYTEAALNDPGTDLPAGVEVSSTTNPCSVSIAFASESYDEFVEALGDEAHPVRRVPLGWEFQADFAADAFDESEADPFELLPRLAYRVTLPGPAGGHNAHNTVPAAGGTTFVWEFGPDAPVPEPVTDPLGAALYEQDSLYASSLFEHPAGTPVEPPAADTFDWSTAAVDPLDPEPVNGSAPEEAAEPEPPASTSAPPMPAPPDEPAAPAGDATPAGAQMQDGSDGEGTPASVDGVQSAAQPSGEAQPEAAQTTAVAAQQSGDGLSPWVWVSGTVVLILLSAAAGWHFSRRRDSI